MYTRREKKQTNLKLLKKIRRQSNVSLYSISCRLQSQCKFLNTLLCPVKTRCYMYKPTKKLKGKKISGITLIIIIILLKRKLFLLRCPNAPLYLQAQVKNPQYEISPPVKNSSDAQSPIIESFQTDFLATFSQFVELLLHSNWSTTYALEVFNVRSALKAVHIY